MKADGFQGEAESAVVGFRGDAEGVAYDVIDFDIFWGMVSRRSPWILYVCN